MELKLYIDVTRHLKTITLFSEYLFKFKQELLTKTFSVQEISNSFPTVELDNSFDFVICKLNCPKINNCYRQEIKNVIFTFSDMFNNHVIFQNCSLTVFYETLLKQ